jgi:hypothetical protein
LDPLVLEIAVNDHEQVFAWQMFVQLVQLVQQEPVLLPEELRLAQRQLVQELVQKPVLKLTRCSQPLESVELHHVVHPQWVH